MIVFVVAAAAAAAACCCFSPTFRPGMFHRPVEDKLVHQALHFSSATYFRVIAPRSVANERKGKSVLLSLRLRNRDARKEMCTDTRDSLVFRANPSENTCRQAKGKARYGCKRKVLAYVSAVCFV